jgi:hypothetical protein
LALKVEDAGRQADQFSSAQSEITVQPRMVMPLAEERDRHDRDHQRIADPAGRSCAITIVDASSMPPTIGSLRARFADPRAFEERSDNCPHRARRADAPMYGSDGHHGRR